MYNTQYNTQYTYINSINDTKRKLTTRAIQVKHAQQADTKNTQFNKE